MHKFQKIEAEAGKRQFHADDSRQGGNSMPNDISGGLFKSKGSLIQRHAGPDGKFFSNSWVEDINILVRRLIILNPFHGLPLPEDEALDDKKQVKEVILILENSFALKCLVQPEQRFLTALVDILHTNKSFQTVVQNCNFSLNGKQLRMWFHFPDENGAEFTYLLEVAHSCIYFVDH